jgi:hypothetical protein
MGSSASAPVLFEPYEREYYQRSLPRIVETPNPYYQWSLSQAHKVLLPWNNDNFQDSEKKNNNDAAVLRTLCYP